MRKMLLTVGLSLLGVTFLITSGQAADSKKDMETAIYKKAASAINSNKGAIKKDLRVDFRIRESMYLDAYEDAALSEEDLESGIIKTAPYSADLACKAYVLDKNWLIVSATCMRYSQDPVEVNGIRYTNRTGREVISPFKFKGHTIPADNYEYNSDIMLLWTGDKETADFLNKFPKVNILAVSSPEQLFTLSANGVFKINTARFGTNAVRERDLKSSSIKGNKFQLDEGLTDLSGTATDPIFFSTPNEREFIAGYNNGMLTYALQIIIDDITNTFDGRPSKEYFSLGLKDLDFIKQTVLEKRPSDWNRIKQRLFYNQTATPYFN